LSFASDDLVSLSEVFPLPEPPPLLLSPLDSLPLLYSLSLLFSSLIGDEFFDLLIDSKIKLFSHKNPTTEEISESLFGKELCLKNILN
jgi:hypothetical protein